MKSKNLSIKSKVKSLNVLYFDDFKLYLLGIISLLILLIPPSNLIAQIVDPPLDCTLRMDSIENVVIVEVPDTNSISTIEVIIGTIHGSSDIFEHIYTYDQENGLPNNYTYLRNGSSVHLGIGNIENTAILYSRVRLKSITNNWSDWFQFISN